VRFNEKPEIYLDEKFVDVTVHEVKGGEIGECTEEIWEETACLIFDSERESKTVGDREEIFGDDEERLEIVTCMMNLNTSSQH
jgi:hypothetical protein